jgi:hypothetical protein
LLYNSYEIKNYVDIVYFVINCYEQLKLNRSNIPLLLTGIYDVKGDLVNTLDRFIANIIHETLKREDFLYEPIFKKVPVSRFPNLFKVLKCE